MNSNADDIVTLYILGTAWTSWIQANKSDWNAISQLVHVKAVMARIVELDNSL